MQRAVAASCFLSFGGIVFLLLSLAADSYEGRNAFRVILTIDSVLFFASAAIGTIVFLLGRPSERPVTLAGVRLLWISSFPCLWLLAMFAGFGGLAFAALTCGAAFWLTLAALTLSFFVRKPIPAATKDSWTNCPMCGEPANHDYCSCPKCGEPRGSGPTARC